MLRNSWQKFYSDQHDKFFTLVKIPMTCKILQRHLSSVPQELLGSDMARNFLVTLVTRPSEIVYIGEAKFQLVDKINREKVQVLLYITVNTFDACAH